MINKLWKPIVRNKDKYEMGDSFKCNINTEEVGYSYFEDNPDTKCFHVTLVKDEYDNHTLYDKNFNDY